MIITDGILTHADSRDIDVNGVLHIPDGVTSVAKDVGNNLDNLQTLYLPDSLIDITEPIFSNAPNLAAIHFGKNVQKLNSASFTDCPKITHITMPIRARAIAAWLSIIAKQLTTITVAFQNNETKTYPVHAYFGVLYHESQSRKIGKFTVKKLHKINLSDFATNIINDKPQIGISLGKRTFVQQSTSGAIRDWRKFIMMQKFEYAIWKYKIENPEMANTEFDWENILRHAIMRTLDQTFDLTVPMRRAMRNWTNNINTYAHALCAISAKYTKTCNKFYELESLSMPELEKLIAPTAAPTPVNKSCTRWLTRHPVTPNEMHAIVMAGYKNPGAFPASWLRRIEPSARAAATEQLHNTLRKMAVKLYSPSDVSATPAELKKLAHNISQIIHQPIQAKYLGAGDFAKTYTLQIPGDKKYVWKIYHCDRTRTLLSKYQHNTELQNSFLMGGRRHYGKTKFRQISTAGISNQRGEIYLLYPYTDADISMRRIYKPFECVEKYSLTDRNSENFRGHTIIDMGALHINHPAWHQPRFVSKIIRTVLYHSWNDLGYVLNNYNSKQIGLALSFISGKISFSDWNYESICKKINFLKQHAKIR